MEFHKDSQEGSRNWGSVDLWIIEDIFMEELN